MMLHCRLANREASRVCISRIHHWVIAHGWLATHPRQCFSSKRLLHLCGLATALVFTCVQSFAEDKPEPPATSNEVATAEGTSEATLSLAHVPANPEFLIALRPNAVFDRELLKIFQRYMNLDGQNYHPVSITHIEEVMFATEHLKEGQKRGNSTLRFDLHLFRANEPIAWDEFLAKADFEFESIAYQNSEYLKFTGHNNVSLWPVDEYIYIAGPDKAIRRAIERHEAKQEIASPTSWPGVGQSQLVILMASDKLAERLGVGSSNSAMGALKGMLEGSDTFAMALHMDESSSLPMNLRLILGCQEEKMVPEKLKSLAGLSFFLKQMIMTDKKQREESGLAKQQPSFSDAGAALFEHMQREQVGDSAAVLTLSADVEAALATAFLLSFVGGGIEPGRW